MKTKEPQKLRPAQHQDRQPGLESEMNPQPISQKERPEDGKKLRDKVAIITGGDSGIGRAVAVAFAKEGAKVSICYLNEENDAVETKKMVEEAGGEIMLFSGDIGSEDFCEHVVKGTVTAFGKLDIVVNNAAEQHPQETIEQISAEQLERTFRTNVFGMFFMVKAAMKHLREGAAIINTSSVTAYRGSKNLLDYSATKGAIVSFTRALSGALAEKKIRVNGVAPGPIWTPLIPSTFPPEKVEKFGSDVPMGRAGEPSEVAPCYVFLASTDSSYITGQFLHPNGGEIINT